MEFDKNSGDSRKRRQLWCEMSILALATAFGPLEERLKKEFPEKTKEEVNDIFTKCLGGAIHVLSEVFNDKTSEEIFDIYASYTWFDSVLEKMKAGINKRVEKFIRDLSGIKEACNKEQYFAQKVRDIFDDININEVTKFAKNHVSIQGLLLLMDAFAGVEQEQINKDVVRIWSIISNT